MAKNVFCNILHIRTLQKLAFLILRVKELQNTRVWAEENSHEIHTKPLLSEKIGLWCALSSRRNIGRIFSDKIVTTEVYLNIFSEFMNQITDDELADGYLQQDGATYHTSSSSMRETESYFGDRFI